MSKYVLNPFTGQMDDVGDDVAPGTSGDFVKTEEFTLSGSDIINKYIVLTVQPNKNENTSVFPVNGIRQTYVTDFIITVDNGGKRLSWNGLGLETILTSGDKLVVNYTY